MLIALGLLRMAEGLEFVHPIVREAVYEDMSPLERADAHARAASLLAESGAPDERVAAQLVACAADRRPAAGRAPAPRCRHRLAEGAPATAATWLERALAEPPPASIRGDLLLELSSARLRLGTPEAAIEPLTTAIALIEEPELRTWATRLLGSALTWSGRADGAQLSIIGQAMVSIERRDRELALLLEADRAAYAQQASLVATCAVAAGLARHATLKASHRGSAWSWPAAPSNGHDRPRRTGGRAHIERVACRRQLMRDRHSTWPGRCTCCSSGLLPTDALDTYDSLPRPDAGGGPNAGSIPAQGLPHRVSRVGVIPAGRRDPGRG